MKIKELMFCTESTHLVRLISNDGRNTLYKLIAHCKQKWKLFLLKTCPLLSNTVVLKGTAANNLPDSWKAWYREIEKISQNRKQNDFRESMFLISCKCKCQLDEIFSQSSPSRSLPRYFRFFSENIVIILRTLSWDNIIVQNKLQLIMLSQH